jgi:hypothetical protein
MRIALPTASWLFVGILALSSCSWFTPEIKKIDSIEQARAQLLQATAQTLVVFDMDHTLMVPTEQLFNLLFMSISDFDPSDHAFIQTLITKNKNLVAARKGFSYQVKLVSAILAKTHFIPVEQNTTTLVKELQARGIKVIALTSSNTGRFGSIESMQQWRLNNLHQIGLDFSASFAEQEITFTNLPAEFGFPAIFYHGILCAALNPKGKVLAAFLDKINWKPANIIFFDDSKQQSESIAAQMKKRGIPTTSYWYRGAYQKKFKLDQNLIQRQFDHWATHEEFLSTSEIGS